MKKLLYSLIFIFIILGLTACKKEEGVEKEIQYYTVTFVQEGQENIVMTVERGSSVTELPALQEKKGYDAAWDDTNLSEISRNHTITAVYTPKIYAIKYDLGICKDNKSVQIEAEKQEVTYEQAYTLYVPSCSGYTFKGWTRNTNKQPIEYFGDGIYLETKDIELTAVWTKNQSGASSQVRYCTITFAQKGEKNIVKKVKKGGTLKDIPKPKKVKGYDVVWDRTDFTNITQNITVTAVLTAKKFIITYDLGERKNDKNVQIKATSQEVAYDQAYTLYVPSCKGYAFSGWTLSIKPPVKYFKDGIYKQTKDITLIAVWNKVQEHEWTENY